MEINRQDTNGLNAVLKVKVGVKDYQEKVDNILKDYRKKMQMPGFRPGMVPIGMVKKMYGKAVLADEINKLLNDSIYKYIEENKLEILGNPLPKDENLSLNMN
jgi:trigger factor